MNCAHEPQLTAYVDEELEPAERQVLEAHLPSCDGCRQTLSLLQRMVPKVEALERPMPSAHLKAALLRELSQEPRGLRPRLKAWFESLNGWQRPALGLGAALAVTLLVVGTGRLSKRELLLEEADPWQMELAAQLEVVADYDVVGLNDPDDLELVEHLHELEVE
jgi:anti-sigma factor RsiW